MKTIKKILVLTLVIALCIPILAQADNINVTVNGELIDFTGDQPPMIDEAGRTLVPIRKVFEKLGSDVYIAYDEVNKIAMLNKGITNIAVQVDNPYMTIAENGESRHVLMDTAARNINGRVLIPARAIAEALGASVEWDGNTRTVSIASDYTVVGGYVGNAKLLVVHHNGKYGCIDQDRKIVIPIEYDSITFTEFGTNHVDAVSDIYNNDLYAMARATKIQEDGSEKTYYLGFRKEHTDENGNITPSQLDIYDHAEAIEGIDSFLFVSQNGKWGAINMAGKIAVSIEYDERPVLMNYHGTPRVMVKKNGLFGISTLDNRLIADTRYNVIGTTDFSVRGNPVTYYQEGYVCAMRNGNFGYIDMDGNEVYPFNFLDVKPFQNGKAEVLYNGEKRKIEISRSGEISLLPMEYTDDWE